MSFLNVSGISKRKEDNVILSDINFTQERLQKIAIAGETGSGKSSLLKIIAGLMPANAGEVLFENKKVYEPEEKLLPGHEGIAYLSQHFELRNNYRVEEVLEMANKMPAEDAQAIYEVCRITHLLKRRTDQLSGGEKQRIAVARLLSTQPKLVLLDEPYSNLDMVHKSIMKSVINDMGERLKITCILVSHDPLDTLSWADEILVMKDGQIIQQAPPKQVYNRPVNEYVAGLFGNYNLITAAQAIAFSGLPNLKMKGQKILVRPENFKVMTEETKAVKGEVTDINFFGSYYEMKVLVLNDIITIRIDKCNAAKGDTVYVAVAKDAVWYM